MRYLRTNTATIVTVGPFYDKTDGVTIETALTITNERITFIVDNNDGSAPTLVLDNVTGATSGTSNDLNYITNNDAGLMQLELAAANVNYVGRAMLSITDAANHCPVFHEFMILPANVYDSLILGPGTDLLDVNASQHGGTAQTGRDIGASVLLSSGTGTGQLSISSGVVSANAVQLSGDATAADNAESFFDGTGYAGTNNVIPSVTTVSTTTNLTNLPAAAATAAELAKVPKSDSTVSWNATALAAIQSECNDALVAYDPPTNAEMEARTIAAANYATAANLATVDTVVDAILVDTGTDIPTSIAALPTDADVNSACDTAISDAALATATNLATVDTVVDAVKAVTDKLDTALELDGAVYRYTENALENAPTGTGGFTSGDRTTLEAIPTLAEIEATSVLAKEATVATVDGVVDAIKAKTDSLTFAVSGQVDANIKSVIGDAVVADSTKTTNWGGT